MIARRRNEYRTPAIVPEGAFDSGVPRPCSFESWSGALRHNRSLGQTYP